MLLGLLNSSKLWEWTATAYLILIPCLWWREVNQDQIQAISFHLGTMALLAVSMMVGRRREWTSPVVGIMFLACLVSMSIHGSTNNYSITLLQAFFAITAITCLVERAPSVEWITKRLVWLAYLNVGYFVVQKLGYDPLFTINGAVFGSAHSGLFSRVNNLAILCAVTLPFTRGLWKLVFFPLCWFLQSSVLALSLLVSVVSWNRKRMLIAGAVILAALILYPHSLLVRLEIWKEAFGQSLWSPIFGYGESAWMSQAGEKMLPTWTYNVFLSALHSGGILLLFPLLWAARFVVRQRSSLEKTAFLLLLFACCFHSVWDFTRLVIVSIGIVSAFEIRRLEQL